MIKKGSKVRVKRSKIAQKKTEQSSCGWSYSMDLYVGRTGKVIVTNGKIVDVEFPDGSDWWYHKDSLTLIK